MNKTRATERTLHAIELAVKRHPSLEGKTFIRTKAGGWAVAHGALYACYSSTEAMVAGILVELIFEAFGSGHIKVRPGTLPDNHKPSQLIWFWAPAFYEVINLLDAEQKEVLTVLIGTAQHGKEQA